MPAKKILLVEGEADKKFFTSLLRKAGIKNVEVCPPYDLNAAANGQGNAIALLPSLFKQMNDGTLHNLAVIIDADYKSNGKGWHRAFKRVSDIARSVGYEIPDPYPNSMQKFIFHHSDGLPNLGLWIMPNCQDDGMLEHLVACSHASAQATLLKHADNTVGALQTPLFNVSLHKVKATVYTWLSWQKIPDRSIASAVDMGLIDLTKSPTKECIAWLKTALA